MFGLDIRWSLRVNPSKVSEDDVEFGGSALALLDFPSCLRQCLKVGNFGLGRKKCYGYGGGFATSDGYSWRQRYGKGGWLP